MDAYSAVPAWVILVLSALYVVLQIVALKQFSGKRYEHALKTLLVPVVAGFWLIDRWIGATGWAAVEELLVLPLVCAAIVYLAVCLVCELREQQQSTVK